ncbi:CDP-glycerol glycerophosphotransferase family protein [Vibrio fluvialis]|nr:CDP-glycerol glycerophosphotransferase family protein [Vibrio fluvialis]
MLTHVKKYIPVSIKIRLLTFKHKMIESPKNTKFYQMIQKRKLFNMMQHNHKRWLKNIKDKEKIKVVFLVMHKNAWKVDPVFKRMMNDPYFEPVVLVCPYSGYGDERVWQDIQDTCEYFKEKGYPTQSSYNQSEERWIKLEEINPDIVFFNNPHNITYKEYYEDAYLNYLSCYVPYAHDVSKYDGYNSQYNQQFHNAMWLIFVPHKDDLNIFKHYSQRKPNNNFLRKKSNNVIATGYPACEPLLENNHLTVWKKQNSYKYKIIWAPHHTINDPLLPYSNFLRLADFFKEISIKYNDKIQLAFKPHPILKEKLYRLEGWGVDKTDEYYQFWETQENTQLENGEYIELFKHSDAMIHDSGSFLAEYQYTKKPVLFICSSSINNYLNPFGIKALRSCQKAETTEEIEDFIISVINQDAITDLEFFDKEIKHYFNMTTPSKEIIKTIKKFIKSD